MTRRGWLRLMAAGVLVVWLCLFCIGTTLKKA